MKFPITREELQSFDNVQERERIKDEEIQKMLDLMLDGFCKEFVKSMPSNSTGKQFVWRKLHQTRGFTICIQGVHSQIMGDYLPVFIEKLNATFIGCNIIIDPLKTYLIIDWS